MKEGKEKEIIELKLPHMGESIVEATIINWKVSEGDRVEKDGILLEVATDKVDTEIPSPTSGKITKIFAKANAVVKIKEVIGEIEVAAGELAKSSKPKKKMDEVSKTKKRTGVASQKLTHKSKAVSKSTLTSSSNSTSLFFSPLIKNIAKQHHISYEELARIPGTGNDGRLRKSDVFSYIEEGRPALPELEPQSISEQKDFQVPDLKFDKGRGKIVEMDRMRQLIADHMVFSKLTSPHVTAFVEADLTEMVNWRTINKKAFEKKYGEKLTFTPLFVEAVARAIKDFPMINTSLDGKKIIVKDNINIGMATTLPSGNLIVPVIKNADKKDLKTLASKVNELVEKSKKSTLRHDETRDGTFTISNVGTFGSLMGTPIINQPEVAILATGIIKKRAEVMEYNDGDKIEIRKMMYLSLSFDHRVVDGFLGGSFLRRVVDYLEDFKENREI